MDLKSLACLALVVVLGVASVLGGDYEYSDNVKEFLNSAADLVKQGKLSEAQIEYENVLQIDPQNQAAALPLFDIYLKRGDVQPAARLMERIHQMGLEPAKVSELEARLKQTQATAPASPVADPEGPLSPATPVPSAAMKYPGGLPAPTATPGPAAAKKGGDIDDGLDLEDDIKPAKPSPHAAPASPAGPPPSAAAHYPGASPDPKPLGDLPSAKPAPSLAPVAALPPVNVPPPSPAPGAHASPHASPHPSPSAPAGKPSASPSPQPSAMEQPLSDELVAIRKGTAPKLKLEDYEAKGRDSYQEWKRSKSNTDFARAEAFLAGAVAKSSKNVDTHFMLAVLQSDLAAKGDAAAKQAAIERFEKALTLGPNPLQKEEIERFLQSLKLSPGPKK